MTDQQRQQNVSKSRDGGYTIIESLVAMIVVSVLMIAIAPVMAFSVATRVQARRVELATQAARTYIDALRTGAIKLNNPPHPAFPSDSSAAPASSANLYCVNFKDQTQYCAGSKEFYVQGVRPPNIGTSIPTDTGYDLTVRVYRADAFSSPGTMKITQQSVANSALGDPKAPLVVMQTQIPPTTQGGSSPYRSLCDRLRQAGNTGC
ncbi:prepilin-type N-terminal cleavage/methylation domain-containing protein [Microcoleus sp. AR_TQ3_B6]|uniref:prepilin-type N-terminal cleavage/methylation domain-containing protein n=1 Tax=Microcoleus sp. AR_TQ3_B6 TaxID=3055284 RepID=UPI002FD75C32